MDVKIIFLNGNLHKDVYMTQLEGFESKKFTNKVCKLQKSIYRLKQASRSWNIYFDKIIKQLDLIKKIWMNLVFIKSLVELCCFLNIICRLHIIDRK